MRKLLAIVGVLLVLPALWATPAAADPYVNNAAIDELFEELRVATDETEADEISRQMWREWFAPSDPDLATRMSVASNFIGEANLEGSLDELNGVVADFPDYAEGWNQRATVHFMMGNHEASLADIEKVLAIEPRHFGALSGRVMILLGQGKHAEALRNMRAALAIHPFLRERRLFPELAQDVTQV
ncbi:MAG TPA: hypothetical protein VFE52_05890 [Devosia sp.]|jgi:tetratricopeptide (TPR) repeat protein|nr:hypothetical protein [Devosia sp.]